MEVLQRHPTGNEVEDGPTLLSCPENRPFKELQRFGQPFWGHFRRRKLMLPQESIMPYGLQIVDTPGMIDMPVKSESMAGGRGYNFLEVVRWFAKRADLILLLFDPDRPGTTGESLDVLTRSMAGLDHKFVIILNKVDQLDSSVDFARAYGTLGWALSKVIPRKDIPQIYTMYNAGVEHAENGVREHKLPLEAFRQKREEVVQEVLRARTRHWDNVITATEDTLRQLEMVCTVTSAVSQRVRRQAKEATLWSSCLVGIPAMVGFKLLHDRWAGSRWFGASTAGVALLLTFGVSRLVSDCEGGVVPAEEKDYEALLTAQLDQLRANLLQQHRAETDRLRKHNLKLRAELGLLHQGISADDDPLVTVADKDLANSPAPLLVELHPASDEKDRLTEPAHRWGLLVASLLDGEDSGWDPAPVSPPAASFTPAPLQMKASWAAGVHQMRQFRSYRTTLSSKNSTMRMQDAVQEEDSIFQRFVVGPRSKQQMIWSTVGAIWIVWDLITIPLGLFEDEDFIRLMSTVARVSFVYWFFDIPVHFFFGIEKRGKLEMRPSVLAKHYLRGWFWVDVMIVALDATLILVEALRDMGVNSTIFRSARFLRTLRLLRLLRLLRVAKLQQELMILANSFLSTHAFMVVKICVGLVMMLMINHVIACCWYGIGTFDMNGKNWIVQAEMESAPFGEAYAASMHWALTQFTPATQDIAASNAVGSLFATQRQRKQRSVARQRIWTARRLGRQPPRKSLRLLLQHHSKPRYREADRLMGRGKANKPHSGRAWDDGQWSRDKGGGKGSWKQQPSSSSQQWDRSWSRWDYVDEDGPTFPSYSMMAAEPEGRRGGATAEEKIEHPRLELAKGYQKMVSAARKAEVRMRKAMEEQEKTQARWQKFQDKLQQAFIKERALYKKDLAKWDEEIEQQRLQQKEALLELRAAIANPEKLKEKPVPSEEVPEEATEEWLQLLETCNDDLDEEMTEAVAARLGRQLQCLLETTSTPPRTTRSGIVRTPSCPRPAASRATTSLDSFMDKAISLAKQKQEVASYQGEPDTIMKDPYVTSPGTGVEKPPVEEVTPKRRTVTPRTAIKLKGRAPLPSPRPGTALAARLEKSRARLRKQRQEGIPTIDESDEEDEILSALPTEGATRKGNGADG
ncbi:EH domain-containing protein 4 [Symbiodinium microadriaticum]|uniref:EH domain-containing protein 4 n=1 Tax=Symbiodinium microadriaticum TaxID=2951 RepID=A0A1Q9D4X3_SYMMI|nr:EH domain-containing protein 4 [Symbiodinium microadriaticum]